MSSTQTHPEDTISLSDAQNAIRCLADRYSVLLLSAPGVGKSDAVAQAAEAGGLPLRSLLGTQIAPEDVSGVPRIIGERSVFCPPRVLLPESNEPFCLFLDELPATNPDVQKALYSLLLERRIGEHALPPGTWVVAAGNRTEDRALVRAMSSALVNRVVILNVRTDVNLWLQWAARNGIRKDIMSFILFSPESLARPVPTAPVPFSTPRAWATLSRVLDRMEADGPLGDGMARALAFGTVSAQDAAVFCALRGGAWSEMRPLLEYLRGTAPLPEDPSLRWLVLSVVRSHVHKGEIAGLRPDEVEAFLGAIRHEDRYALLVGLVDAWGKLGAGEVLLRSLRAATGIE
jgi:hypothetical protein